MKKKFLAGLLATLVVLSCGETKSTTATTSSVNASTSTSAVITPLNAAPKKLTDLVKEERAEKNRRDSVFAASRQEVWVYQIGEGKSEAKEIENSYYKLSQRMQHLYFFKQSAHKYFLILHDGYNTEQELIDKQADIEKTLLKAGLKEKVSIINITTYCGLKERIKPADEVKLEKKEWAVCYKCD